MSSQCRVAAASPLLDITNFQCLWPFQGTELGLGNREQQESWLENVTLGESETHFHVVFK